MNKFKIKLVLLQYVIFLFTNNTVAQTEVFKSNLYISEDNLSNFYSSISSDSTQIYVNANDYYLYAFDKKTGTVNWSHYLANKSNKTPIIYKNSIIIGKHISEYVNKCIQLDCKSGDTLQTLKIKEISNQPFFKNDIMYVTAISEDTGGCILAYNLTKNEIIWKQFIAHGVSKQPYFLKDKIVANAEDDNWFEIDYNGILKDTLCKKQASTFVENIKCVKYFRVLTHDNKEIDESFLSKNLGEYEVFKTKFYDNKTFFLGNETLLILGKNKKILHKIDLNESLAITDDYYNEFNEILKIENNSIWLFVNNRIVEYNYQNKSVIREFDLSEWHPHCVILENDFIHLISKKDGQLYRVKLDFDTKASKALKAKAEMLNKINNYKPDLNKIEAEKAAREKLQNKNN